MSYQVAVGGQAVVPGTRGRLALRVTGRDVGGHVRRIVLTGELDYGTAPDLRAAVSALLMSEFRPAFIDVDVAGVTFIDSTGLGTLAVGYKICADMGTTLRVTNPSPFVWRLMEATGVRGSLLGRH